MATLATNQEFHETWTANSLTVLLCTGISLSNALELLLLVVVTFKHYKGLYFWSLLITTLSLLPYSVGFILLYYSIHPVLVGDIMNNIGWMVLITGQSMVLYSRLGVIYHNQRVRHWVLAMILLDGFVFYVSTTIIHYGTYSTNHSFSSAASVMERVQMTVFSVQEVIISGIYLREVIRYQRVVAPTQENARRTIWELFGINVILIAMDVALLTLEYRGFRALEQAFKALAYSFKLKLEFAILGKLVDMARAKRLSQAPEDVLTELDTNLTFRSRSKSDITHASFV